MDKLLSLASLWLFALVMVPGYIMHLTWSAYFPSERRNMTQDFLPTLVWGLFNFALLWVLIPEVHKPESLGVLEKSGAFLGITILPALLSWIGVKLRGEWLKNWLPSTPWRTSWDSFFGARESCIAMFHMKSGDVIAGLWTLGSHATRFPDEQEIYLRYQLKVDKYTLRLQGYVDGTDGVFIKVSDVSFVEFYELQTDGDEDQEESKNEQQQQQQQQETETSSGGTQT